MKIIQIVNEELSFLNKNLTESGEGNLPPFPYTTTPTGFGYKYTFVYQDKQGQDVPFEVTLTTIDAPAKAWDISFKAEGGSYFEQTNHNVQYKLMSTILKIVSEFVGKEQPEILSILPSKQTDVDEKRERLYLLYVYKAIKTTYHDYDLFKILYKYNIEKRINNYDAKEIQKFLDHLTTVIKEKVGEYNYMVTSMMIMEKQNDKTMKTMRFISARQFYADYMNAVQTSTPDALNEIIDELQGLLN